jgi:hypothetical protein
MTMIRTGDGFVIDNDNPLPIRLQDSAITLQTDKQNNLSTTIQTHSGAVVAPSGASYGNYSSSWIDADGWSEVAVTCNVGAAINSRFQFVWSNDNSSAHGYELPSGSGADGAITNSGTNQFKQARSGIKARYFRIQVDNLDGATPITVNSWVLLKA